LLKIIFTNPVERVAGYLKGLFLYRMKYAFYRVACTMGMPITHSFLKKTGGIRNAGRYNERYLELK
jgi:hypothetical protein